MTKKKYPGVDEQALQQIARNFPSTAPIDRMNLTSEGAPVRVVDVLEMRRAQALRSTEPTEPAPEAPVAPEAREAPVAPPSPPRVEAESIIVPAPEPVVLAAPEPVAPVSVEKPAIVVRTSKFPVVVSMLALAVAAAPLLAPRIVPYVEKYQAPQWVGQAIDFVGGKDSLPALRAEALFAQERAERAAAAAAFAAALEDSKGRLLRLETSGSDLVATAARLDRIDEAVAAAGGAQLQAEEITRAFALTLKNSEESLRAAASASEARFLALELAAREAAQKQLSAGQDVDALRQGLATQAQAVANLGEAIAALEAKRVSDRSEVADVAALATQNIAALKAARDEMQGKVDLLNEQLAKLGDALEAAVAIEVSRSASAITEASERATLADERARGLEARLSTYQDDQLRASRVTNALMRLGSALLTSEPFVAELAAASSALAGVGEAAAPLEALTAIAPGGAISRSKLRESFVTSVAPQLRDLGVRYDASLLTRAYTMLSGQSGPTTPEGQRVWEVVAAAETLLAQGDFANALIQVARFEGAAGQITAEWLSQARTRAAADKAFTLLGTIALGPQAK